MFKAIIVAVAVASASAQYHGGYGGHQAAGHGGHQAAGYGGQQAAGYGGHQESGHESKDYYAEPHYAFSYAVHDEHTGDIKSHKEERKGDHTQGVYMLVEADGSKRIVEYVVEGKSGFNAKVQKEESKHPQEYKSQISGYSSGHSAYKAHQPSYSSGYKQIEQSYKPQTSYYKPQISYKPQVSYESAPSYKPEYSQPSYKIDSHYSQPAYKAESHYSQPSYSSSGHATSSISFATHGAKIATSTNHVVPQKGYESKKY